MIKNHIELHELHELKLDPGIMERHIDGELNFQVRYDNRGYRSGDCLWLRETVFSAEEMAEGAPLQYSGWEIFTTVNDILRGPRYGVKEGWVVLSLDSADVCRRNVKGKDVTEAEADRGIFAVEEWPDGKLISISHSRVIPKDLIPKNLVIRKLY